MTLLWPRVVESLQHGEPCVVVTVERAEGSTPREEGAAMAVTAQGYFGTIGGGTLEWHAMAEAQSMLGKPQARKRMTKLLGPDLGQCCGGRVNLSLQSLTKDDLAFAKASAEQDVQQNAARQMHLGLYGAGHIARALVLATAPLPVQVTWWDERQNAFPALTPENVSCRHGTFEVGEDLDAILVMTHSHSLDFEIVDEALRQPNISFVGLIGSETKRARFVNRLKAKGHGDEALQRLHCPIGVFGLVSKEPAIIAASVAVQVLQWQEAAKSVKTPYRESAQISGH
jgi:xanthine dehydrogenase accessory factor